MDAGEIARGKRWTAVVAGAFLVLAAAAALPVVAAEEVLTPVSPDTVCMVNDQAMGKPQIPIEVEGKTYFGCCEMCKQRLAQDEAVRFAVDPVTGEQVDKASAVIAALPDGRVLYFTSKETLQRYSKGKKGS